ncbi:hypothetical protein ACFQ3R_05215 [Mesonia ostreae]
MKYLNIKLAFPYNWYQYRRVKLYDNNRKLITRIINLEEKVITINDDVKEVTIKLDFFKSKIKLPTTSDENVYLILYLNFRDSFFTKYIDTLKRECLTGKFVSKEEFNDFNLDFYSIAKDKARKVNPNIKHLLLGSLISSILIITGFKDFSNGYYQLAIFIGIFSLVSMIIIYLQKQLMYYDYKSRMISTGLAFILATALLNNHIAFYFSCILIVLSLFFVYLVFNYSNINKKEETLTNE